MHSRAPYYLPFHWRRPPRVPVASTKAAEEKISSAMILLLRRPGLVGSISFSRRMSSITRIGSFARTQVQSCCNSCGIRFQTAGFRYTCQFCARWDLVAHACILADLALVRQSRTHMQSIRLHLRNSGCMPVHTYDASGRAHACMEAAPAACMEASRIDAAPMT